MACPPRDRRPARQAQDTLRRVRLAARGPRPARRPDAAAAHGRAVQGVRGGARCSRAGAAGGGSRPGRHKRVRRERGGSGGRGGAHGRGADVVRGRCRPRRAVERRALHAPEERTVPRALRRRSGAPLALVRPLSLEPCRGGPRVKQGRRGRCRGQQRRRLQHRRWRRGWRRGANELSMSDPGGRGARWRWELVRRRRSEREGPLQARPPLRAAPRRRAARAQVHVLPAQVPARCRGLGMPPSRSGGGRRRGCRRLCARARGRPRRHARVPQDALLGLRAARRRAAGAR
mmetsp:Transcript_41183/g.127971  ORF Transcript_41183/g.127971 Transcript_41183/m.127971 type:complete len:289 (+) Transcript_41183:430-1296(+)